MKNKETTITIKIRRTYVGNKNDVSVTVELDGGDHDVMELAEVAQNTKILGENGVDYVLRRVLNEDGGANSGYNKSMH